MQFISSVWFEHFWFKVRLDRYIEIPFCDGYTTQISNCSDSEIHWIARGDYDQYVIAHWNQCIPTRSHGCSVFVRTPFLLFWMIKWVISYLSAYILCFKLRTLGAGLFFRIFSLLAIFNHFQTGHFLISSSYAEAWKVPNEVNPFSYVAAFR